MSMFCRRPSPGQTQIVAGLNDYSQDSWVLSADGIYDFDRWFAFGGKVAMRAGWLKDNVAGTGWYGNVAGLAVARVDFHVVKKWDATIEARAFAVNSFANSQSGFLAAIYRHVNDNFKVGVGYNFTNFSDDLTNVSGDNHGVFVNAVGMF